MTVQIVQFRADPARVGEIEQAISRLFSAIEAAAPPGIVYAAARVGDGPDFLLTLTLTDGAANPLLGIPEATTFRANLSAWAGGPIRPSTVHVIRQYPAEAVPR